MSVTYFFALIIVFFVGTHVITGVLDRRRSAAMKLAAEHLGYEFYESGVPGHRGDVLNFELFRTGHTQLSRNAIVGKVKSVEFMIFDFTRVRGHGRNKRTDHYTIMAFESDQLSIPQLSMRPEHVFHKIGGAMGYQDIDFEENPGFSSKFLLQGSDEIAIREFFTRDRLSCLEVRDPVCIEGESRRLIIYADKGRRAPGDLARMVGEGLEIFQIFRRSRA